MIEHVKMPVVALTGAEAERLAHLISLAQDLTDAREQAILLRSELMRRDAEAGLTGEPPSRLAQALFTSAVITYCRAFAIGRRSGLSEHDFAEVGPNAVLAHRWFVEVRNRHLAHQVLPLEEVRIGVAIDTLVEPPELGVATLSIKHQATDVSGTESLIRLTEVLLVRLEKLIAEQQEVVLDVAREIGLEELGKLPDLQVGTYDVPLPEGPPQP